ncbi:MAG: RNA polymerase sigma factor [Clostridia bacterium]|nr:RNA polymerase sigma factor [Clostridia bacterium]
MAKRKPIDNDILCAEYSAVYHYALSLCRSENDAYDIAQETFLKAMKARDNFEGNSSLYTWLCAIARNIWLDRLKKQGREAPPPEYDIPSHDTPLEQLIMEKDLSMRIHHVLHNLNEPYKEVFSLRVFGQLPFADIARLFGKTESWARVTYHRGRKMITEILRKDGII